jgi:phosphoribosylformylglycinamidine synthase
VTARIGVVTFPGSLDDGDAARAVRLAGAEPVALWHGDHALRQVEAVILPGGFSYGDYLRSGAIARFAPVMESIVMAAQAGLPVLGICNGFQILCEAHLLPGALTRNQHLHFRARDQRLNIVATGTAWTNAFTEGQQVLIPVKSGEGRYVADRRTLDELAATDRVIARYAGGNPNGSLRDIAGVANEAGNVVGLMPHPEHAIDPLTGPSQDGVGFFLSVLKWLTGAPLGGPAKADAEPAAQDAEPAAGAGETAAAEAGGAAGAESAPYAGEEHAVSEGAAKP